jgi:hypothetical protein
MGECSYCGSRESLPFKCKFCGEQFCGDHRLPENHECRGLASFKEERGKEPEKWIYEPFKTKARVAAGREIKKPHGEQLFNFLYRLDSRKILYGILIVIILLTLSKL